MQAKKPCFCGAKKIYQKCCGLFIDDGELPATPEQLMRSRYSAFAQHNLPYIKKTMTGPADLEFSLHYQEELEKHTKWLGLQIVHVELSSGGEIGFVEFIASFRDKADPRVVQYLHERSEFRKIDQRWLYYDGREVDHEHDHNCGC